MDEVKKQSIKEQLKRQKGKVVLLGMIGVLSLYIWSGVIFGKDEGKKPGAPGPGAAAGVPAAAGGPGGAPPAPAPGGSPAAPKPVPASGKALSQVQITSFAAAKNRIKAWEGPLGLTGDLPPEIQVFEELEGFEEEESVEEEPEEAVELTLTATALMGRSKFAVINGKRVKEGDKISRYVVKEVRNRQVVVLKDGQPQILRMAQPALSNKPAVSRDNSHD